MVPQPAPVAPSDPVERIALGSCFLQTEPAAIWAKVREAQPQIFCFLGDNIYFDRRDSTGDFAREYAFLLQDPNFKALYDSVPMYTIWDDHDFGLNDAGEEYPRKDEAQRAFNDFWRVPQGSPRRQRPGTYDAVILGPEGKRLQIVMLDTRYFRSPLTRRADGDRAYLPDTTPGKTMLGEAQWKWLEQELRKPAEVRLIMTSIQFVPEDHRFEKWANLPLERQKMIELIRSTGANGVLFASGDRHLAEISVMSEGTPYPFFDLTASAINRSRTAFRAHEVNRWRVGTFNSGHNFGFIQIDWKQADPLIRLQIRDDAGEVVLQQRVPLSLLQPRRETPAAGR